MSNDKLSLHFLPNLPIEILRDIFQFGLTVRDKIVLQFKIPELSKYLGQLCSLDKKILVLFRKQKDSIPKEFKIRTVRYKNRFEILIPNEMDIYCKEENLHWNAKYIALVQEQFKSLLNTIIEGYHSGKYKTNAILNLDFAHNLNSPHCYTDLILYQYLYQDVISLDHCVNLYKTTRDFTEFTKSKNNKCTLMDSILSVWTPSIIRRETFEIENVLFLTFHSPVIKVKGETDKDQSRFIRSTHFFQELPIQERHKIIDMNSGLIGINIIMPVGDEDVSPNNELREVFERDFQLNPTINYAYKASKIRKLFERHRASEIWKRYKELDSCVKRKTGITWPSRNSTKAELEKFYKGFVTDILFYLDTEDPYNIASREFVGYDVFVQSREVLYHTFNCSDPCEERENVNPRKIRHRQISTIHNWEMALNFQNWVYYKAIKSVMGKHEWNNQGYYSLRPQFRELCIFGSNYQDKRNQSFNAEQFYINTEISLSNVVTKLIAREFKTDYSSSISQFITERNIHPEVL